ncbi:MAG: sulfatase-like hydrolase/transferase [Rhodospirillaceae bacterium]|jgi:arylsulfatase A-like enzyme|nr:sulfatase-like hydrolase/transferase [Rhodospirillaceae bacterium]MBT3883961.1 sulfatase-like hydrolase/transferase [Rhodospirillaceae bacterium]MBT4117693.1 sulfatase-like hydrolase/transferase [Rhodospirillaceae bacterium]MBT4674450.1 sulfatase-like hydrolase/transferase [Rhodospirillaceae bacterium]MBT4751168.1 sulfatase-like hydrolase/transferase [Rhodospirillaceae bacterium]
MAQVKNILFIMCDQLRWDYLGCARHQALETPHIDGLAKRGVLFARAFVQSAICGPSRMSFYTGRYLASHGSTMNGVPLPVSERTLGDYLRRLGVPTALIGKSHMTADHEAIKRLGLEPRSDAWNHLSECGFDAVERDDGMHLDDTVDPDLAYNLYLNSKGYDGRNPWHGWANSADGPNGDILSGWEMANARLAARVDEADSETPYMTRRAIDFISAKGDQPWCLHLSYVKPHWPYMAPVPYHAAYGSDDCLPVRRADRERIDAHPLHLGYMTHPESEVFSHLDRRNSVIPTYMGLVKQIDDQMGVLFEHLEQTGRMDDTMIVFTSDHGDQLGDHWLGEKELFFEESVRIPMIIYDPSSHADATRGARDMRLVEAIDLVPTFIDALGGDIPDHILEGRSLLSLLRGQQPASWREFVVAELNYAYAWCRRDLKLSPDEASATMLRTERWKYIHHETFRAQLFDLQEDPDEFYDLGTDPEFEHLRREMADALFQWLRRRKRRVTLADGEVEARTGAFWDRGVQLGQW